MQFSIKRKIKTEQTKYSAVSRYRHPIQHFPRPTEQALHSAWGYRDEKFNTCFDSRVLKRGVILNSLYYFSIEYNAYLFILNGLEGMNWRFQTCLLEQEVNICKTPTGYTQSLVNVEAASKKNPLQEHRGGSGKSVCLWLRS